jgi:hypothetical protein
MATAFKQTGLPFSISTDGKNPWQLTVGNAVFKADQNGVFSEEVKRLAQKEFAASLENKPELQNIIAIRDIVKSIHEATKPEKALKSNMPGTAFSRAQLALKPLKTKIDSNMLYSGYEKAADKTKYLKDDMKFIDKSEYTNDVKAGLDATIQVMVAVNNFNNFTESPPNMNDALALIHGTTAISQVGQSSLTFLALEKLNQAINFNYPVVRGGSRRTKKMLTKKRRNQKNMRKSMRH